MNRYFYMGLIVFVLVVPLPSVQAQSDLAVNPQNLFDAGLNLGYVRQHGDAGTDPENLPTFAANFSAEWLVAVIPEPPPFEVEIDARNLPQTDILPLDSVRSYLASMPYCIEPYYTSRIATFDAGYFLGLAIASTANSYTVGVKSALSTGGLPQSLRIIGRNTNNETVLEIASRVEQIGIGLQSGTTLAETRLRHQGVFNALVEILNELNDELPNDPIACTYTGSVSLDGETFFQFLKVLSGPSADSNDVKPNRLEASLHGGRLEATVDVPIGSGQVCKARVLYEWRFLEPISRLNAKDEIDVEMRATLLSDACSNSRLTARISGSNNGSSQVRAAGYRTAADISTSPGTPIQATVEGVSILSNIKVVYVSSDYSFVKLDFVSSAPRGSDQFRYEVVYLYEKQLQLPAAPLDEKEK